MGKEIERKFLVRNDGYRQGAEVCLYRQGYLSTASERVVRVRRAGEKGFVTIKGETKGAVRLEYEYEIPAGQADEIISTLCEKPIIEKYRYKCEYGSFIWEIDEFMGENQGLIVAEIELESEDMDFPVPEWVGEEVTYDPRYLNSNLVKNPYKNW